MRKITLFFILIILIPFSPLLNAQAANLMFSNSNGMAKIEGESKDGGHDGSVEIISFEFGTTQPASRGTMSGRPDRIGNNVDNKTAPNEPKPGTTMHQNGTLEYRTAAGTVFERRIFPPFDYVKVVDKASPMLMWVNRSFVGQERRTNISLGSPEKEEIKIQYLQFETAPTDLWVIDNIEPALSFGGIYIFRYNSLEFNFSMPSVHPQPIWRYNPDGSFWVLGVYNLMPGQSGTINASADVPNLTPDGHLLVTRTFRGPGSGLYCNDVISWSYRNGSMCCSGSYEETCTRWSHSDETNPRHRHDVGLCDPHAPIGEPGGLLCSPGVCVSSPHHGASVCDHGEPGWCDEPARDGWGERCDIGHSRGICHSGVSCTAHGTDCHSDTYDGADENWRYYSRSLWDFNESTNRWHWCTTSSYEDRGCRLDSSMYMTSPTGVTTWEGGWGTMFGSLSVDPIPLCGIRVDVTGVNIIFPVECENCLECEDCVDCPKCESLEEGSVAGFPFGFLMLSLGVASILLFKRKKSEIA